MALNHAHLIPRIEGNPNGHTLLFLQGWPDDMTLWDELDALRDRYRCVLVNMPNYAGAEQRRWGCDHDEMVEGIVHCIQEVSPGAPLTLIAHDWGAFWSYRLHHRHPELVSRFVALDIGPVVKPTPREAALIVTYQAWLATALAIGGSGGNWMTRSMAKVAHTPRRGDALNAGLNYPYLYTWKEILTGRFANLRSYAPEVPLMFVYGKKKPMRFHTQRWLDYVRSRPGNEVELTNATHWVTRDPSLTPLVTSFLDRTNA